MSNAAATTPAAPTTQVVSTVVATNFTEWPRRSTFNVRVPFPRGAVPAGAWPAFKDPDVLLIESKVLAWPDGSIHFWDVALQADFGGWQERRLEVVGGQPNPQPMTDGPADLPPAQLCVGGWIADLKDGTTRWRDAASGLWFLLQVRRTRGAPTLRWWLEAGFSKIEAPRSGLQSAVAVSLPAIELTCMGGIASVDGAALKGCVQRFSQEQVWTLLPPGQSIACGQVLAWRGSVVWPMVPGTEGVPNADGDHLGTRFTVLQDLVDHADDNLHHLKGVSIEQIDTLETWSKAPRDVPDPLQITSCLAELRYPIHAVADNWKRDRLYGPHRVVPDLPPWMRDANDGKAWVRRLVNARDANPSRDPWAGVLNGMGMLKVPGSTGDQGDFGVSQAWPAALLQDPAYLELVLPEALKTGLRPSHFREADVTPFRSRNHPGTVSWTQRPHRDRAVSPDDLGLEYTDVNDAASHGWYPYDDEHDSILFMVGAFMLTADPQLRRLLDDEVEAGLSGWITSPPFAPVYFQAHMGPGRATGRTLLTASWLYLVDLRDDLLRRIQDRVQITVANEWAGRNLTDQPVRPLALQNTDTRQPQLPINVPAWWPWQEALAVIGLVAAADVMKGTGRDASSTALSIASIVCRNFIANGWVQRGTEFQVLNAQVWDAGHLVDPNDPNKSMPADGTDFVTWVSGAVKLYLDRFRFDVDDQPTADLAVLIWGSILRRRGVPNDHGFDRFASWAAV